MLKGVEQPFFQFSKPQFSNTKHSEFSIGGIAESVYESDEFRMYTFKIKKCPKSRRHDWTECPFAHRGEKAQRRDPLKFNYYAIECPEFRDGDCPRGNSCKFAHGLFEFWLHPARYRTCACKAGQYCNRKVCFFAHTTNQLWTGTQHGRDSTYRINLNESNGEMIGLVSMETSSPEYGNWDFMEAMRGLKIGGEEVDTCFGAEMSDLPDIDWVSELLN